MLVVLVAFYCKIIQPLIFWLDIYPCDCEILRVKINYKKIINIVFFAIVIIQSKFDILVI